MLTIPKFMSLSASMVLAAFAVLNAQQTVTSGVYTDEQATRGKEAYSVKCASCHGDALDGGAAPSLAGSDFLSFYAGETLGSLFTKIKDTMPATEPGTMTSAQTADMVAFILKANELPAGSTELPMGLPELERITFEKK